MAGALAAIGAMAGAGLFLTTLPLAVAIALAPLCGAWGAALAYRALHAPTVLMAFRADGTVFVDGARVDDAGLDWRGPLTCIRWQRGGRHMRLVAWPDVVPPARRRELRLWRLAHRADASTAAVAT